jgi:hypothetical protein
MKIDAKEVLNDLKDCVQVDLSKFAVMQTDKIIIPVIDSVLVKLNKLIPGPIDDAVVASIKPQLYKEVKEELEKLLNKVDDVINGDDK